MVTRHNGNVGIKLFRWSNYQAELWLCRKGTIPAHRHNESDSKLIFLWGTMLGTIGNRTKGLTWKNSFRVFDIPARTVHGAEISSRFCVFINWQRWLTHSPRSAALDFEA